MRVAIYSGEIPSTTFIERLITGLAESGTRIVLFGVKTRSVTYQQGVEVYATPQQTFQKLFFAIRTQIQLRFKKKEHYRLLNEYIERCSDSQRVKLKLWAKYGPVVLHLPQVFHMQWAKSVREWMFLQELFGVKVVLSLRGAHINYSPIADEELAETYRKEFPRIERFHAVSKDIAAEAVRYGAQMDKISVVYSGLDLEKLNQFNKTNYRPNGRLKILCVGRFHWKKGYSYALDALSELRNQGEEIVLQLLAGKPDEEILFQINELELHNDVQILPKQDIEDVYRLMQYSDCLLLPSVEEGVANVVLEAMAIGLPVVSSDCGGMSEVITHEKNGLLFGIRDVSAMIQCIKQFIDMNEANRSAIAQSAKETIQEQHPKSEMVNGMNQIYSLTI